MSTFTLRPKTRLLFALILTTLLLTPKNTSLALPAGVQEFYVLGDEEQVWQMFQQMFQQIPNSDVQGPMASVITLVATADNSAIYYDHWEDGYETDLLNPIQASTEPYLRQAGQVLTLNSDQDGDEPLHNAVPINPRGEELRYDGRDRILVVGGPVHVAHAIWPLEHPAIGGAWELYPVGAWPTGYSYIIPVGKDLYQEDGPFSDLKHVWLQIQALEQDTRIYINPDGNQNGGEDTILAPQEATLGRGESYSPPEVKAGTMILSNKPIQCGLITAGAATEAPNPAYRSRFYTLVPDTSWDTEYIAPPPFADNADTAAYLYNPNETQQTTIAYGRKGFHDGEDVPVSALAATHYAPSDDSGLHLYSPDGPFWAGISADAGSTRYDWGYSMIPARFAGRDAYISWAPAMQNEGGIQDTQAAPVWISPLGDNTTFTIDYPGGESETLALDALQLYRVYNHYDSDGDNTGIHIQADRPFVVAWGQDPDIADDKAGTDLGYTIIPQDAVRQKQALTLTITPSANSIPRSGAPMTYTLLAASGEYPISDLELGATLPAGWDYVNGSTHVTAPNGNTSTPEPTTESPLLWQLGTTLAPHQSITLTFQAHIASPATEQIYHDDLESSDGSGWPGSWEFESSDPTCATRTIRGTAHSPSHHLRICNDGIVSHPIDLSSFQEPVLRFWRQFENPGPSAAFGIRLNDGNSWHDIPFSGSLPNDYAAEQHILECHSQDCTLSFESYNQDSTSSLYLDDLEIFDAAATYQTLAQAQAVLDGQYLGAETSTPITLVSDAQATVRMAPVSIWQTVDKREVEAGQELTYQATVSNYSTEEATAVVVRTMLPANTEFVFADPQKDEDKSTRHAVVWEPSTPIAPGESQIYIVTVRVSDWAPNGQILRSQSSLDCHQTPAITAPSLKTIVLAPQIVLSTQGLPGARHGQAINYTIEYTNTGPVAATGVQISNTIPTYTEYIENSIEIEIDGDWQSLSDSAGNDAGQFVDQTITVKPGATPGHIEPNERGRIRFSVQIKDDTPSEHDEIVEFATLTRPHARPQQSPLWVTQIGNLGLTKSAAQNVAAPGTHIDYALTLSKVGPAEEPETEVYITDTIPAHTTYVPDSAQADGVAISYSTDGGQTWTNTPPQNPETLTHLRGYASTIDEPQDLTLNYQVQVNDSLPTNTDICSQAFALSDQSTNLASEQVCVPTLRLSVTKSDGDTLHIPGQPIIYTITYGNAGSTTATSPQLVEIVPPHTLFNKQASTAGWSCDDRSIQGTECVLDTQDLPPGSEPDATFVVTVTQAANAPLQIANQVTLVAQQDIHVTGQTTTDIQPAADLSVTVKSESMGGNIPNPGDSVEYAIIATNYGPSSATGTTITNDLPPEVSLAGLLDPRCNADQLPRLKCQLGTLEMDEPKVIKITVKIPLDIQTDSLTNHTTIDGSEFDPDETNNSATTITSVNLPADLEIQSITAANPAIAGKEITYLLTVKNLGPANAENVIISDTLPAGLTFVDTNNGCHAVDQLVTCHLGRLNKDAPPQTISIKADVAYDVGHETTILNQAEMYSETQDDFYPQNNKSPLLETTIHRETWVTIQKHAEPSSVIAGNQIIYTISVENDGPSVTGLYEILDELPAQVDFAEADDGCSYAPDTHTVTCNLGILEPKESISKQITVTVQPATTHGMTITNTAVLSTSEDTNKSPIEMRSDSEPTEITREADLYLTTQGHIEPAIAGNPIGYVWELTNLGSSIATNVEITDTLPPYVSFEKSTPEVCKLKDGSDSTLSCTWNELGAGKKNKVYVEVTIDPSTETGTILEILGEAHANEPDPDLDNNHYHDDQTTSVERRIGLSIQKTGPNEVVAGQVVVYMLSISNAGPSAASNVIATDVLMPKMPFVADQSDPDCTLEDDEVTCRLGKPLLPADPPVTFDIAYHVDSSMQEGAILKNTATVSADEQEGPDASAEHTATVRRDIDLSLTFQTPTPNPAIAGHDIFYTLFVLNNGPSDANNVHVQVTPPEGLWKCLSDGDGPCEPGQKHLNLTIDSLPKGKSEPLQMRIGTQPSVPHGYIFVTEATAWIPETDIRALPTSIPITVEREADLRIEKRAAVDEVIAGDLLTYTLDVVNDGPSTASQVTVTDVLSLELAFANSIPSGICQPNGDAQAIVCGLDDMDPGQAIITLTVRVQPWAQEDRIITNQATVATTDPDPNLENNDSPQVPIRVLRRADLSIEQTYTPTQPIAGEQLTYTLTLTNTGPSDTSDVTVTNQLPPSMIFDSATPGCTWNAADHQVRCNLDTFAVQTSIKVTTTFTIPAAKAHGATISNTVRVAAKEQDPDLDNNQDGDTLTVHRQVELSISKTSPNLTVFPEEELIYTITITNAGPSEASGIVITDELADYTNLSDGSTARTVTQTLNTLAPGEIYSMPITVTVAPESKVAHGKWIFNTASVRAEESPEELKTDCPIQVRHDADLEISVTDYPDPANPGQTLYYTLVITNHGPLSATNLIVTDTLPDGLIFEEMGGDCKLGTTKGTVICEPPDILERTQSLTITIPATLSNSMPAGTIINRVEVQSKIDDGNNGNNKAFTSTTVKHFQFLPMLMKDYACPICDTDNFEDPTSGWITCTGPQTVRAYQYGKYYIATQNTDYAHWSPSPLGLFQNYTVRVDANWAVAPQHEEAQYGIIFDFTESPDGTERLYTFLINNSKNTYQLWQVIGTHWIKLIPRTKVPDACIQSGTKVNELQVRRKASSVDLYINACMLESYPIADELALPRPGQIGMLVYPSDTADTQAYFDNFTICTNQWLRDQSSEPNIQILGIIEKQPPGPK